MVSSLPTTVPLQVLPAASTSTAVPSRPPFLLVPSLLHTALPYLSLPLLNSLVHVTLAVLGASMPVSFSCTQTSVATSSLSDGVLGARAMLEPAMFCLVNIVTLEVAPGPLLVLLSLQSCPLLKLLNTVSARSLVAPLLLILQSNHSRFINKHIPPLRSLTFFFSLSPQCIVVLLHYKRVTCTENDPFLLTGFSECFETYKQL